VVWEGRTGNRLPYPDSATVEILQPIHFQSHSWYLGFSRLIADL